MLRPLRIVRSVRVLRALRLGRLSALAGGGAAKSKRSVASRATNYVLIVTGSLVVICSVVVLDLERSAKGATIRSFGDALWWALSTITTVGYGDHVPVTAGGKAVAAVLMVSGIGLVGVITAAIAAFFVGHDRAAPEPIPDELAARLTAIEQLLSTLAATREQTIDVAAIRVSQAESSPYLTATNDVSAG
jgi:voltage-gated potassium channel